MEDSAGGSVTESAALAGFGCFGYRFADHKEKVIDLLMRVTTVSVRIVAITEAMKKAAR